MNFERDDKKKVVIPDPEIGPIIKRMFERYAQGDISLEDVGLLAMEEGLPLQREGNFRATVQYAFKNPFYYGDFVFKGKLYKGIHGCMGVDIVCCGQEKLVPVNEIESRS